MMMEYNEWQLVEKDLWEKTYESEHGRLIYIDDKLDEGQSEIDDWLEPRYQVKLREPFWPETREEVLNEMYELEEAELYIDLFVSKLENGRTPDI